MTDSELLAHEIHPGDDTPVSLTVFQAQRAAAQLRDIGDGGSPRHDAELVARFLHSIAYRANPVPGVTVHGPSLDPQLTWDAVLARPMRLEQDQHSGSPVYVVTGRPRYRSHGARVVVCTRIHPGTWPPTFATGVHVGYHRETEDRPVPTGSVIFVPVTDPSHLHTSALTLYDPTDQNVDGNAVEVEIVHNAAMTVEVLVEAPE